MEGSTRLTILADTGALYALADRNDVWHERVTAWWTGARDDVAVPISVLPEITHLLGVRRGADAEAAFVREAVAGVYTLEPLENEDLSRSADLIDTYADLPLGFVDASIVAMAERLGVTSILTTDRRHFGVIRPAHCERLRLLP